MTFLRDFDNHSRRRRRRRYMRVLNEMLTPQGIFALCTAALLAVLAIRAIAYVLENVDIAWSLG